jgi:hypothetical protein
VTEKKILPGEVSDVHRNSGEPIARQTGKDLDVLCYLSPCRPILEREVDDFYFFISSWTAASIC